MKSQSYYVCAVLFLNTLAGSSVSGSNILFFHAVSTASHRTAIWPLAEKLADSGHNVTYIFPVERKMGSHPKIEELTPSKMVPLVAEFVDFDINMRLNDKVDEWAYAVFSRSLEFCEAFYDSPEIQEWLARPGLHYDLVMLDILSECAYGLVYKFKAKHILFFPTSSPPFLFDGIGIVPETSSIPDVSSLYKPSEMNFMARVQNTIMTILWRFGYLYFFKDVVPIIEEKLDITNFPAITEFEKNTSLVLVNHHFVEDYPRSLPPMVVPFSGIGCNSKNSKTETSPLPKDISSFIGNSEDVIYVSFGSAVVVSSMPISLREEFFEAFKALPKIKFLWRWTGDIPSETPKNAMLLPWFPQRQILTHPKIRGFVTQGGRPSTHEALCYAVPLITIPMFADQDFNANRLESIGAAIQIDIKNMSSALLKASIEELIQNQQRKSRMVELSNMFKDHPIDPLENVLYWVEYVLRYDTSLLKPLGINQTWYQRRLLDVYAFISIVLLGVTGFVMFITVFIAKFALRLISARLHKRVKKE
ncbi:unnamed protein product [Orchesella dallaii]|uniref:UDP-glucuronosyltransferase n=1 Tax=Orchesella dallaii TaxID=48710 RepID=A0ABP1QWA8_9HEXA